VILFTGEKNDYMDITSPLTSNFLPRICPNRHESNLPIKSLANIEIICYIPAEPLRKGRNF
ncbi:MAG: hypothetical protein KDH97_24085, partial [Calditrichaeota bacterium]|nr:hypothetical protein [Calditrichota bacterium]